jgi:hypothetical protein
MEIDTKAERERGLGVSSIKGECGYSGGGRNPPVRGRKGLL